MKLLSVVIENYGHFRGHVPLTFSPDGWQLIYGPNEAGKTTLLQLLRELLFGFPHISPYAWEGRSGEMAVQARAQLADGRKLEFRRRKGRRNEVVGQVDGGTETFDAEQLAGFLGHANEHLYRSVFGFSLAELAAGEKSLESASLNEALFGSGLGGLANFQRVQQQLKQNHEELFRSGNKARKTINVVFQDLDRQQAELRQSILRPADYESAQQRQREAQQQAEQARSRWQQLQRQRGRIERLRAAHGPFQKLQSAQQALAQLTIPAGFVVETGDEYQRLKDQSQQVAEDLQEVEAGCQALAREQAALVRAPELLAERNSIERLYRMISNIQGFRRDLPLRAHESQAIQAAVAARVQMLHPSWDLKFARGFQVSLPTRQRLEQLVSDAPALAHRLTKQEADVVQVQLRLQEARRQLAPLSDPAERATWEQLLARTRGFESDRRVALELQRDCQQLDIELQTWGRRLHPPGPADWEQGLELPVPRRETVQEFQPQIAARQAEVERARERVEQAEAALKELRDRLRQGLAQHEVPSREELVRARQRRDVGWKLFLKRYVEGKKIDSELNVWLKSASVGPDATLLTAYEREVRRADELADERQAKSELVAQREQDEARAQELQRQVDEARQLAVEAQRGRAEVEHRWHALWSPCGFVPLSCAAMLEWLRLHTQLLEKLSEIQKKAARRAELLTATESFERSLQQAFGRNESAEVLLLELERRVADAQAATARGKLLREQIQQDEVAEQRLRAALDEARSAQQRWNADWQNVLQSLQFPQAWTTSVVGQVLEALRELQAALKESNSLETRVRDMTRETKEFEAQVVDLVSRLAPDLAELLAEHAVDRLFARVQAAQQAEQRFDAAARELETLRRRQATLNAKAKQIQTQLEKCLSRANTSDEARFWEVARQAREAEQFRQEVRQFQRELDISRAGEKVEDFLAELEHVDSAALELQDRELSEHVERADLEYSRAREQVGALTAELDKWDGRSEAPRLASELEHSRAKLVEYVDRWAPQVLAAWLLGQAIERFEREHQPEMLREAGDLLRRMTAGRYVEIKRQLDKQGTPLLKQPNGKLKEPSQLSTGTRELLYLALRLAYVRHYCRRAEPLPLIMDDILVNFDDARREAALAVLRDLSREVQVLFLTCHHATVTSVQSLFPGHEPLRLEPIHPE